MNNRLSIVEVSQKASQRNLPTRLAKKQERQANYERLWLIHPQQFHPFRNCMEAERIERTWQLIQEQTSLSEKSVVDLGCGEGTLARRLDKSGATVQAVDIASNALKRVKSDEENTIKTIQDVLPETSLPDSSYDIVISTEVIGELDKAEHRLFFAELSRLVKPEGFVVFSTPLDIDSEDALQQLIDLAHTELNIIQGIYSYHSLYLRIKRLCKIPGSFIKACKDPQKRENEIRKRLGINKFLFRMNSTPVFAILWTPIAYLSEKLVAILRKNRRLLLRLEKICRFFSDANQASHGIFVAKRRPFEVPDQEDRPIERPKKREVWE